MIAGLDRNTFPTKGHLRFFSIIGAFSLWFFVLASQPIESEFKLDIIYKTPDGMDIANEVPHKVLVKVRGSRAYLKSWSQKAIVLNLDDKFYRNKKGGKVSIAPDSFSLPFGTELLSWAPEKIDVELDRSIFKKVPIKAVTFNNVTGDQKLVDSGLDKEEIMIEGPYSIMKTVGRVETDPIDLALLNGSGSISVPLKALDPRLRFKGEKAHPEVTFNFDLRPTKANLLIKGVPILFLAPMIEFYPERKSVDVKVLVRDDQKKEEIIKKIKIIAHIPQGAKGSVPVELKVEVSEDIHLLQIQPQYINVRVKN